MSDHSRWFAANDNGDQPKIRVLVAESTPINVTEVEIFDGLISNIAALVANDNDPPPAEEKSP